MKVKELGHIVLYVGDLARSRRFYGETLGWREITPEEGVGFPAAAFSSGRTHHELLLIEVRGAAHGQSSARFGVFLVAPVDQLNNADELARAHPVDHLHLDPIGNCPGNDQLRRGWEGSGRRTRAGSRRRIGRILGRGIDMPTPAVTRST